MIRRAIIVMLTVATLLTGILFVASFAVQPAGVLRDVIDSRDTLVVLRAHRGGLAFYISRMSLTPHAVTAEVYDQDPEVFKTVREYRRTMLLQWSMANPAFYQGSNATRFGCSLPTQNANAPIPLPTKIGYLTFPIWCPLLAFAIIPAFVLIRGPLRRRARRKRNECVGCGYNMTGNESGVCPECGGAA